MTRTGNREQDLAAMLAAAKAPGYPEEHDESALGVVLAAFNAAATENIPASAGFEAATGEDAARDTNARPALLWWVGGGPAAGGTPRQRAIQSMARCAAAIFIVTGGGVAVASTGILPDPIQSLAHHVLGGIGVPAPKRSATHGTPATVVRSSASTGGPKRQTPQPAVIPPAPPPGIATASAGPLLSPMPAAPPVPGTLPPEASPAPTSSPSASASAADDEPGKTKPPKPSKSPKAPKPAKSSEAAYAPKSSNSPLPQLPIPTQSPS